MSKHEIVHIEIPGKDTKAAGKFYGDLFGWKIVHDEDMNYTMFGEEGEIGGGFTQVEENNPVGRVVVYVSTDDIEASLAKAEELGGKTVVPKSEIPMTGWFGIFTDPTGNYVGLYTPMPKE